ncbi:hypothetical protein [Streptomyces violascens]|uniref:hypothetical protein n=1 Tax=Streptomyces violascens TaxID=67381 RepID=UPI0036AD8090
MTAHRPFTDEVRPPGEAPEPAEESAPERARRFERDTLGYRRRLYTQALRPTRSPEDAEDLAFPAQDRRQVRAQRYGSQACADAGLPGHRP